jgi:hypothetical protein
MDAFLARTSRMTPQVFLKSPRGVRLQRQGVGVPVTEKVLTYIEQRRMYTMATQEVLGSNIPLVASASTPDEALDQGFYQAIETINAFAITLGINRAMTWSLDRMTHGWGKGLTHELTHDQKMWRNFALSAPLFAYLAGIEFFTPLLRNMLTLKRTQEVEFSKITSVSHSKNSKESKEDKQKRLHSNAHQTLVKQRMAEYVKLCKRDVAIMLPTALGLLGVGLMGMKHQWKMPKIHLDTPQLLKHVLGPEHPQEAGLKKMVRQGTQQFVSNVFGAETYNKKNGKIDLLEECLLPQGDWEQASRLLIGVVFALPTYIALWLYSRDDVEKPEIGMRAMAYLVANILFPNAVENWVSKHIKPDAHIPYVGGKKNIELLAGTLAGSVLYALLPMLIIRLTRPWRAKRAEEKQARQGKSAVT